ncbi:hypothetical protein [Methanocaldococcus fervens]|nr:hypothetical protein [Methanocaldococcus fervens]
MYLKELFKLAIKNKTLNKEAFIQLCNNLNIPITKRKGWFKQAFYELVETLKDIDIVEFAEKVIGINTLGEKQKEILKGMAEYPTSIILAGKGSGKDFMVSLLFNYMLMKATLKENLYSRVNFVNIAPNMELANKVFFKEFKHWFKKCLLWQAVGFEEEKNTGKAPIRLTKTSVSIGDNIELVSGHSHSTSFEGMNVLCAVIDEISDENFYNAEKLFYQLLSSIKTRFGTDGKLIVITWTRFPTPNPLDDVGYKLFIENQNIDNVFTFKGKTWEINPFRKKEDFADDYERNPILAKKMYECEPPDLDAYFIDVAKLDACMVELVPLFQHRVVYKEGKAILEFKQIRSVDVPIFAHFDLSLKHDSTAIAIAYTEGDKIIVSDIIEIQPTKNHIVDYKAVEEFIEHLRKHFTAYISFDQFNSAYFAQKFSNAKILNWSMPQQVKMWKELQKLIESQQIKIQKNEKLRLQILQHQVEENKVKYFGEKSPDLADALIGAVYECSMNMLTRDLFDDFELQQLLDDDEIIEFKSLL